MNKSRKRILYFLGFLLFATFALYLSPYGYLLKGIRLTYLSGKASAHYYDKGDFDLRKVETSNTISSLPKSQYYNKADLTNELKDMLAKTNSGSYLVLRNDSIIAEHYFGEHTDTTGSNAFSMTKSIITMLVQIAIQEGKINSWDDKAIKYLPWLKGPYAKDLTLRHLSTMTAGIDWEEHYKNPLGVTAKAYYGDDLDGLMKTITVIKKPGEIYKYQSGSTQMLAMALKTATGENTAVYASEHLWKKIGAEHSAYWHLDKDNGTEICYCCFNAVSRDFARLGVLMAHRGMGILDSTFFNQAIQPYKAKHYGHSFWIASEVPNPFYFMHGMQGQFVAVVPKHNLVVVRTGAGEQKGEMPVPECIQVYVNEAVKLFGRK
jgi:CubicO group peptidase (beta-lactamase class C family)